MVRLVIFGIGVCSLVGCGSLNAPSLSEARRACDDFGVAIGGPLTDETWEGIVTIIQLMRDMGIPSDEAAAMSLVCIDVPMIAMAECRTCLNDLVAAVYR